MLLFFPCFEFGIISSSELWVDRDPCNGIVKELKMIIIHVWKPKSYGTAGEYIFCSVCSIALILFCGTGTAGTVTFCLSRTGTGMHSGSRSRSGTGFGFGSNIK
jgi:hypothetical protein